MRYRWSWLDALPLAGLLGVPASSLFNGLGVNDAIFEFLNHLLSYTILYFLGRVYFSTPGSIRELAIGIAIGILVYLPLMLWEIRMSPQLHRQIYGFQSWAWQDVARDGGFRPRVFFVNSLGLGIWAASAVLVVWWLWLGGATKRLLGVPIQIVAIVGLATSYLSKCLGAFMLLLFGIGCLVAVVHLKWRRMAMAGAAVVAIYLGTAIVGEVIPIRDWGTRAAGLLGREDKEGSLRIRFVHESILLRHALGGPVIGWGGHGRNRPSDSEMVQRITSEAGVPTRGRAITDGKWTIIVGKHGFLGLLTMWGWMVIPATLASIWAIRLRIAMPIAAPVFGLAGFSYLYAIDQLLNAFWSPVQALVAGGLVSFVGAATAFARQSRSRRGARAVVPPNRPRLEAAPLTASAASRG